MSNSSDPAIKVRALTKSFRIYSRPTDRIKEALFFGRKKLHGEFEALKEIDLDVYRGQTVGIIGQNGSGKSTFLKILARLMMPTSGEVEVRGVTSSIIELGTGFHGEFSGRSNVQMTASLMGFSRQEFDEIFPRIHEFSELGDFIDRPVKTYSSGMWVRLAFSTAIAVDPEILLIDEALTVGDLLFQKKCMSKLKDFQKRGTSIVFVSHDLSAIKSLCDRTVLLDQGEKVSEGSADAICSEYISLVAKRASAARIEMRDSPRHRRYGSYEVEIDSVRMLDRNGNTIKGVRTGDRVTIEVDIKALDPVENLSVGILIRDRLGNDVFGTNTYLAGLEIPKKMDRGTVAFDLNLDIGPRQYYLAVALHAGEDHLGMCYDWMDSAIAFQVLPGDEEFTGYARLQPKISVCETVPSSD